ncbi:hypothetical protein RND81_12G108400 [Saponaria officinalis]|uniref:Membrane-associated kinase regulator 6 n=1 Tax=Saponaria officinalis TaxID=3572 RepID=A0AAW1H912_SAPOF
MSVIETSQPLSIESFSYSWLINLKPSLIESLSESFRAALDSSDESSSSFIEMDPNMPPSRRFVKLENDFDFNVPFSEQSVPADELFSNGLLLPLVDSPRPKTYSYSDSSRCASPFLDVEDRRVSSGHQKIDCSSLRRCKSLLSRKMFEKYLQFLCPLLEKIRLCKLKSSRRRSGDNRICPLRNNRVHHSPQASPRTSICSSPGDWRRSCDSESSIHEAVLHCKRSFGK